MTLNNSMERLQSGPRRQSRWRSRSIIRQFLSVPNQLTMFRLLLLPFILIAMIYRRHDIALGLFLLAVITDVIDGIIARRLDQQTMLGEYLDPIADKLLLSSAFIVQALIGAIPWWLTILVLSRDLIIISTVLVVMLATEIRDFPPSAFGKANTVVQAATISTVVLYNASEAVWAGQLLSVLIWAAAATTLASSAHYMVETMQRVHAHTSQEGAEGKDT